jgi:putative acetyltransferase
MSEPVIRKYEQADCDAVIEVWSAASSAATPFLSEEFLAEERERIRTIWLPKAQTWVIESSKNMVGFISLIGNEVGALFVHLDFQGRGLGRALMDHAASMHDELFLDVFEDNFLGRRFYDRYGFTFVHKHIHEPSGHMQIRLSYSPGQSTPSARNDHKGTWNVDPSGQE